MMADEAREVVSAMRTALDRAMRAVSTPEADWERYMLAMLYLSSRADRAALYARKEYIRSIGGLACRLTTSAESSRVG